MKKLYCAILLVLLVITGCQSTEEKYSGNWVTYDNGILILNDDGTFRSQNIDLCQDEYYESNEGTWSILASGDIMICGKNPNVSPQSCYMSNGNLNIGDFELSRISNEELMELENSNSSFDTASDSEDESSNAESDSYDNSQDNTDSSYNQEPNTDTETNDLSFLKNNAICGTVETSEYGGFTPSDNYCNDPDQVEYNMYEDQQTNIPAENIWEDEQYKVIRLNRRVYVYDKSISSDTPQQSIYAFGVPGDIFYKGEYLYICFHQHEDNLDHYKVKDESFIKPAQENYVLVVEKDRLTFLTNVVFSHDNNYMCHEDGSNLYVVNTNTFAIQDIEDVDPEIPIVISNNGTVIYCKDDNMYFKYLSDPNLYNLQQEIKPIYIDNAAQALFIETEIGIKKLTSQGEEWVFKYAGFDSNAEVYYGVDSESGKSSPIVDIVGYNNDIIQEIDLTQY